MSLDAKWKSEWESDGIGKSYGDLFFARASGALPEMESSKAAAKRLATALKQGDRLLDVGCGAGHYYRSIRGALSAPVQYTGVDATPYYIERARAAFEGDESARFVVGDIYGLDFSDRSFDVVLCSNVLIHLPSISRPLRELCRVTGRHLLVRTLISDKSYVIMDVTPQPDGDDFDEQGSPRGFHYLNIYGEGYVRRLFGQEPRVLEVRIEPDRDFSAERISDTAQALPGAWDATRVVDGMQISGPILMPWCWISIDLAP
jgi:SAM-dependent methyltransferase